MLSQLSRSCDERERHKGQSSQSEFWILGAESSLEKNAHKLEMKTQNKVCLPRIQIRIAGFHLKPDPHISTDSMAGHTINSLISFVCRRDILF